MNWIKEKILNFKGWWFYLSFILCCLAMGICNFAKAECTVIPADSFSQTEGINYTKISVSSGNCYGDESACKTNIYTNNNTHTCTEQCAYAFNSECVSVGTNFGDFDNGLDYCGGYIPCHTGLTCSSTFTSNESINCPNFTQSSYCRCGAVLEEPHLEIINPTEGYEYKNIQPTPFLFEYRDDYGIYNQVLIQIDNLNPPQVAINPLVYNIGTTTATSTGMVYLSLANGNYRVQGFLYNTLTDDLSSSTGYINFSIASSTVPIGTYPDWTDQDYNELTSNHSIWSTSSINSYFNNNYDCTSGNWWDKLSCSAGKMLMNIPNTLTSWALVAGGGFIKTAQIIFPFNIPNQIYSCWQDAKSINLPVEVDFLDDYVDAEGNLTIDFPVGFGGGATSTNTTVFGPAIFREPEGGKMDLFFGFTRMISKYLLWAGWIWALWGVGKDTYAELMNIKKEDTIE